MPDASALPTYRNPPVGEVLLALQFQQIDQLDLRHVGALVGFFNKKYPHFQIQPNLEPVIERFDGSGSPRGISFRMMEPPAFPRLWLVSSEGAELLQLQRDRLMHNWRHVSSGSQYPRYPRLRTEFADDWSVLEEFLSTHALGAILPTQCEVAYFNQIEAVDAETDSGVHTDPSTIFSFFDRTLCKLGGSKFEAVTHSSTGIAREDGPSGTLMGRLYIEVISGFNSETRRPTYQFSLTLRGAPLSQDLVGVLQFFDFAHERIVRAFSALTTSDMHKIWERLQ